LSLLFCYATSRSALYTLSLHDALPISRRLCEAGVGFVTLHYGGWDMHGQIAQNMRNLGPRVDHAVSAFVQDINQRGLDNDILLVDRKSTRLNSSHLVISYAVFCLKKKK